MRILVVNPRTLLMEGVESLLGANGHFEVLSTPAGNIADLRQDIKHSKPNIVIIDEAMTFIKPAHLITSLPETTKIRLIVINSRTSRVDIYERSEFSAPTLDHFLEAIREEMAKNLLM
jgi:DNA-binding NarL/FixJ family response regulator